MLLFWYGATQNGPVNGWTFQNLSLYYLLLVVAGSVLMAHIESDISYIDIEKGRLSVFLLKPFSYLVTKFFVETAYRLVMGIFAAIAVTIFILIFPDFFKFTITPQVFVLSIVMAIFGYLVSFLFKMILGISALWFTDNRSLYELNEIIIVVFAGFLMPIPLLPDMLQTIAKFLPLEYMIYYPVAAFTGKLSILQIWQVLSIQVLWIIGLYIFYRFIWRVGISRFTAVGQ